MLAIGSASVDAVDVVDAAADGIPFDDPDAHVDSLDVVRNSSGRNTKNTSVDKIGGSSVCENGRDSELKKGNEEQIVYYNEWSGRREG